MVNPKAVRLYYGVNGWSDRGARRDLVSNCEVVDGVEKTGTVSCLTSGAETEIGHIRQSIMGG